MPYLNIFCFDFRIQFFKMINIFWKRIFNLFMPYFKNCKKKYKYIFLHFYK